MKQKPLEDFLTSLWLQTQLHFLLEFLTINTRILNLGYTVKKIDTELRKTLI